ncbi:unnamed protein product [Adineta ricciae]|uniref:NACHT domain-containing protein n=1 Tax=Adineta ricciae TaxID=249248 RepID=A0A815D1U2_ADIRI|nr:unnamed protein product [Adineta ricciae]
MEDDQLYRGRFDHVGNRQLNSIRIFVSSTFTDTAEERNGLIDLVYPRLRDYCLATYNVQFQYSDMRWGIQSTAANTHATVDMCLNELDTCCQLSMATNCIVLLSHRYGSRFSPAWIPEHIFHSFEKCLASNLEEKMHLSQMYRLDENFLEKRYFLRSIEDQEQWDESEKKLQNILRKAADLCYEQKLITKDERDDFHISVTAQEIYRALKNNKDKTRRMICFLREIHDIDQLDSKFQETGNITEIQQLLKNVKTDLHQALDPSDVYTYQVRWKDDSDRTKYLNRFFEEFYQAVKAQVDLHLKIYERKRDDKLYNQVLEHAIQSNLLAERFFPRPEIFEQIKAYLTSTTNEPCVLVGESGTGKSSIMAKIVNEIPKWYPQSNSISVIVRFLGATPSSSDIRRPLISIIEQICLIYHLDRPMSSDNVKETLENILQYIPKNEHLVLLLDSFDQLQISDLTDLSIWLPEKFPTNVKCILSTIAEIEMDNKTYRIYDQIKAIYKNELIEIQIKPFNEQIAQQAFQSWLEIDRRCLTPIQYEWIKPKFNLRHYATPLFISLIYDQTLTWHSYDDTPDKAFLSIKNTRDAIGYLYNQLGIKHGQMLFRRAMRYVQLAGGLSELEIEDILSLDDEVLQSVFVHYLPPLGIFRLPSNLWIRIRNDMHKYLVEKDIDGIPCIYFYHRSFQHYQPMNVKQLILDGEEKEILEKIRLAYFSNEYKSTFDMSYSSKLVKKYNLPTMIISVNRCLTQQKPWNYSHYNLRRLHQLCININRYDFAHRFTMFDYDFLSTYLLCREFQMSDLLYDFSVGALDPNGELRFLLKQYEASTQILNQYPTNLSFELIYRLHSFIHQLPDLTLNLLAQCINHCPLRLLTDNERQQSLVELLLSDIIDLAIDAHRVFVLTSNDKLYVFSHHYYGLLRTGYFDISYKKRGGKERLVSFLCQYPYICCLSSNSSMVVLDCEGKQVTMQTSCGKLISFLDDEHILLATAMNDMLEIWNCSKNCLVSTYEFPDDIIVNCTYRKPVVRVTLERNEIVSYLTIDDDHQFQLYRVTNERLPNGDQEIFLNDHAEFCYSFKHPKATLILTDENKARQLITNIDFQSPPISVVYLSNSKSIAWLNRTSLMIFHPLYDERIFQPFSIFNTDADIEYDVIHDNAPAGDFEGQSYFLVGFCKTKGLIDVFEWRYLSEEQRHEYRQLVHLQLPISIDQCVFTAGWFDGITLYCSDKNSIYKYNATMLTYLHASKSVVPSLSIDHLPKISSDQYLTFTNKDHYFQIMTLNPTTHTFQLCLLIHGIKQYQFSQNSSSILLVSRKNIVSVYSLKSSKLLWTTNEFEHRRLQIHSFQSSFLLVCLQTKQIFLIDGSSFAIQCLQPLLIECCLTTLASDNRLYALSNDHDHLVELNLNNKNMRTISLTSLNVVKIAQMYSVDNYLIFHTDDDQVFLWHRETEMMTQLESTGRLLIKNNQLLLVSKDNKNIIIHDLKKSSRQNIQIDDEIVDFCIKNDDSETYLFVICQDRLLRMYQVSNGKQILKLFIHKDVKPFIGILHDHLLLKVANHLCLIQILNKNTLPPKRSLDTCLLFQESMWMTCHHHHCSWLNALTA